MRNPKEELQPVYASLDRRLANTVEAIRKFLGFPHDGPGMASTAALVAEQLAALGCTGVEVYPTEGNPIVAGVLRAGASVTLLIYLMYDTAPVLDHSAWNTPPFTGTICDLSVGRALVGRGSLARRGPLIAFTQAIAAMQECGVQLPVNLVFLAEGDENLGSPHLPGFFDAHGDLFAECDATFFPAASQGADGSAAILLGAKGMLGLELTSDGAEWGQGPTTSDIHWGESAWVDSPMWRLAHAIATLASPDGSEVRIDGFYDQVRRPDEGELRMLRAVPFDAEGTKRKLGIRRFSKDVTGEAAFVRNLYEPAIVLQGSWGSLPPVKRLYRKATSRIDFRLVRDQTPGDVEAKVKRHLTDRGFGDIAVRRVYAVPCSVVAEDEAVVRAAVAMYRAAGVEPELWPSQPKTPPPAVFQRPFVMAGVGHGGNHAAANEYLLVEDGDTAMGLPGLMRSFAQFLLYFAEEAGVKS